MEVEGLGARCALSSCKKLDYLPLRCGGCRQLYCSEHQRPETHQCSSPNHNTVPTCPLCQAPVPILTGMTADDAMSLHIDAGCPKRLRAYPKCAHPSCSVRDPAATACVACHQIFCIAHCVEVNHDCRAEKPVPNGVFGGGKGVPHPKPRLNPTPKTNKSHQPILKLTSSTKNSSAAASSSVIGRTDFANTNTNPIGDPKIDSDDRIMLSVFFPADTKLQARHMYFNSKSSSGNIIDSLHRLCPTLPPPPDGQRYSLYAVKPNLARVNLLPYITPLRELSGIVQSGDSVILQVGDAGLNPAWLAALQPSSSRPSPFSSFSKRIPKHKSRSGTKCLVS